MGIFKMAALLVEMHEVVENYIKNDPNRKSATEIGGEVLNLTRAVIKKHTFPGEKAFKFHLAQPSRMLARTVGHWNKGIKRRMKRKSSGSHPWTVKFKWNLNMEVFDCLKVAAFSVGDAKTHKETRAIHEIHFTNGEKLKALFYELGNKYKKSFDFEDIFIKTEKDKSFSCLIVSKDHPASIRYSKNSEVLTFKARYGHFNRNGVPQHCLVESKTNSEAY